MLEALRLFVIYVVIVRRVQQGLIYIYIPDATKVAERVYMYEEK